MSLQGTLDTFGLPDVLALLSSTKKKGELRVSGPGFRGSVWMDEGKLVGAEVPRCPTLVDAVFELLRLPEGEFAFEAGSPNRGPISAQAVGDVLSDAEERLIEWRDIAIHIPSVHVRLKLVPASPSSQITLDADQWRLVVASSLGATLADLSEAMQMGEFQICRTAKNLVETGLATVETAPAPVVAPAPAPAPVEAAPPPSPVAAEPQPAVQPTAPGAVAAQAPSPGQEAAAPPPAAQPAAAQPAAAQPAAAQPQPAAAAPQPSEPPKIVEDEPAAEPGAAGEPVDRSALLKFLSSVRN